VLRGGALSCHARVEFGRQHAPAAGRRADCQRLVDCQGHRPEDCKREVADPSGSRVQARVRLHARGKVPPVGQEISAVDVFGGLVLLCREQFAPYFPLNA